MGRLSRHLGIGEKLIIDGQEYSIKPLTITELPLLFKLGKYLSGVTDKENSDDLLKSLPPEGAQALVDIIMVSLKRSFPDETDEDLAEFGMKYMNLIFPLILKLNSVDKPDDMKRRDAMLEHIKKTNEQK
jgi:hypothetical protein